jgi:hypothetical protein
MAGLGGAAAVLLALVGGSMVLGIVRRRGVVTADA